MLSSVIRVSRKVDGMYVSISGYRTYILYPRNQSKMASLHVCHAKRQMTTDSDLTECKTLQEMPGPRGLPWLGDIFSMFSSTPIKDQLDNFTKHGLIYRQKVGSTNIVHLADVEAVEKVHRREGKYPRRVNVPAWIEWRERSKHKQGILISDGENWNRMRKPLDKSMLRPPKVATYTEGINKVIDDFITRLEKIQVKVEGDTFTVPNMDNELFHWSLETIGTVIYNIRFGGLDESGNRNEEMRRFISAVHNVFEATGKVGMTPRTWNKYVLPKWLKMHDEAWDTIFEVGTRIIDKEIEKYQHKISIGEEVNGLLPELLQSEKLSREEVYANISELMLGGVDTTSNTMQWLFYNLAKHPNVQEKLQHELDNVLGDRCVPTYHDLEAMPYLKAVVKETLRLYPITGVSTRILNEDLSLCGYRVPKGTLVLSNTFHMGRNPNLYENPQDFVPERWLRSSTQKKTLTFAWLPFGFGPRMCVGRRIAELEMNLLAARMFHGYNIKMLNDKPLDVMLKGIMVPDRPVELLMSKRKNNFN